MTTNQFTINDLEKMLADHEDSTLQILPEDVLEKYFPGIKDQKPSLQREISDQDAKALKRNMVDISKQLLSILKSCPPPQTGQFSAEELETMIVNHEAYWDDRFGRGDIDADNTDLMPRSIIWITTQLIEVMK